jgi:Family of unknown function (DUF6624)
MGAIMEKKAAGWHSLKQLSMKKLFFLAIIVFMVFNHSFGQDQEKYSELVKEAWNLYETKQYKQSAEKYEEAFNAFGNQGMPNDFYNAACSWALATEIDSAFVCLFAIAEVYTNYGHIATDTDLSILYSDNRWSQVLDLVKASKEKAEANFDKPLMAVLDSIYQEDQNLRLQSGDVEKEYGRESPEIEAIWKTIAEKDSINLIKIQKILDERGWLGTDIIGEQGNSTLFLVIQHSELPIQEKYLPMMREAVSKGNASPSSLALLEDRVALRQGKKQIYGSQIVRDQETGEYCLSPLIDPDNVDKRRAEVGLGTLQDYVSHWDIVWDLEQYKKDMEK